MSDPKTLAGRVVGRNNRRSLKPFVLRESAQVLKTAVVDMFDRHSDGTFHHFVVRLFKFARTSNKAQFPNEESEAVERFVLDHEEASKLLECIESIPELAVVQRGQPYVILQAGEEYRLLEKESGKLAGQLLSQALTHGKLQGLLQASELPPGALEHIGAAARQLHFRTELDLLIKEVDRNPTEPTFQSWVKRNFWVFGTEYVDTSDVRDVARRCQIDILLASIDGFFDVIELKRPGGGILVYDRTHKCYHPHSCLSEAIGQVVHYLQKIEDYRLNILVEDELPMLKPRGRIVIGRTIDWNPDQHQALRKLNAALNNIDVMSYDQLIARGEALIRLYARTAATRPLE